MQSNWNRWHDLLDIQDRRTFTLCEQAEYDRFIPIVERLDDEEAALAKPGIDALVSKHERIQASIVRLTRAVQKNTRKTTNRP